jgi:hypothetical protein
MRFTIAGKHFIAARRWNEVGSVDVIFMPSTLYVILVSFPALVPCRVPSEDFSRVLRHMTSHSSRLDLAHFQQNRPGADMCGRLCWCTRKVISPRSRTAITHLACAGFIAGHPTPGDKSCLVSTKRF